MKKLDLCSFCNKSRNYIFTCFYSITNKTTKNTKLAIEKKQEMPHNNYGTYLQQLPQDITKKFKQLEANRKKEINYKYSRIFNKVK